MRNDAYLGKIEGESLNSGNDYSTLYSFLQINLNNFTYFKGKDSTLEFVYTDKKSKQIETEKVKKYHISLPKLAKKYYNGARLSKLEKALLILKVDKIRDLEKLGEGDNDLMEAVGRIKKLLLILILLDFTMPIWSEKELKMVLEVYHLKLELSKEMSKNRLL